jgi:hypothetical protein
MSILYLFNQTPPVHGTLSPNNGTEHKMPRIPVSPNLFCLVILICFTACASVRAVAKYDSDIPTPEVVSKNAYFWGLVQPDDIQTGPACPYICMVTVKSTFGSIFISAITLGIVVPVKFEYHCCSPDPTPAEI